MDSTSLSPEASYQAYLILSAISVVLVALWIDYFVRRFEFLKSAENSEESVPDANEWITRTRFVCFCGVLSQFLVYFFSAEARRPQPLQSNLVLVAGIMIQLWI